MPISESHAADVVLVESAGNSESEEVFLVLSGREASDLEVRRISGAPALLEELRALAPRKVVVDLHVSFRRGLELLQALKATAPQWKLVARVRSPRSKSAEPLYFSVDVHPSGVSLHRTSSEGFADGAILVSRGIASTDAGI